MRKRWHRRVRLGRLALPLKKPEQRVEMVDLGAERCDLLGQRDRLISVREGVRDP